MFTAAPIRRARQQGLGRPAPLPLVDQPSPAPTNKVLAGGLAGALVTCAVFAIQQVAPGFAPGEATVALVTALLSFALSWLVRDRATPAPGAPRAAH